MKARKSLIAAAIMATFAAGASAAYLSEDVYGTPRQPSAARQSDEAMKVAMNPAGRHSDQTSISSPQSDGGKA
jgi:hypothetical protein